AARLVRQEPRTLRRWLKGYSRKSKEGGHAYSAPLWHTDYEGEDLPGERVISFRDLLELRMVAEFVKHGVSLPLIRATIEAAAQDLDSAYPLSTRKFLTDGKRIFMQAIEKATGSEKLVDLQRKQYVFKDIVKQSLFEGIDYESDSPARWYPEARKRAVVLDPE